MSKYVKVELVYKGITTIIQADQIEQGIFFSENDDILTNADLEVFDAWKKVKNDLNFDDFLYENGFNFELGEYEFISNDRYYSIEEIDELRNKFKYFYNSFNDEFMSIENFGINDMDFYYSHYNGSKYEEYKIDILSKDVELIESDLNWKDVYNRTGKHELYKIDGILTLVYNSFYNGSMKEIEKEGITPEELKEKFDYSL